MREWLDRPIWGDLSPGHLFYEARRKLHLTPMFGLMRELQRRGINLGSLHALEMFGGTGGLHTIDYAPYVASLEVWEIESALTPSLRKNLPNATVEIVDSFVQLRITKNKFDLVIADTPADIYNGHCEHFELFPSVFGLLNTFTILILNIRLEISKYARYPDELLERRQAFYQVEDSKCISLEQMLKVYKNLLMQNGLEVKWWFVRDRFFMYHLRQHSVDRFCYLILALQKKSMDE